MHLIFAQSEDPIKGEFIAIGWNALDDLGLIKPNRYAFKTKFRTTYSNEKKGAIPVKAGIGFQFCNEMKIGDWVVHPSKLDRNVYVGKIISDYKFPDAKGFRHRRKIK